MTDYEAKFYAEGLKINRLVAAKAAGRNVGDEEPAAGATPTIDVSADDFEG